MRKQKPPQPKHTAANIRSAKGVPIAPLLKQAADSKHGVLLNLINSSAQLPPELKKHPHIEIQISPAPSGNQVAGSIGDLGFIPDNTADVLWNAGSLVYFYAHEVPDVLAGIHRVLKKGGTLFMQLPDLQRIAEPVSQGKLEQALYRSPAGGITCLDLIYGHINSIAQGRHDRISHTGFTAGTISQKLAKVGFGEVDVWRQGWLLMVRAQKIKAIPADKPIIRIHDEDLNLKMQKRDTIEQEPEIWSPIKL